MRLLVLRPAESGARTAAAIRRLGHDAVLAPVTIVEPTGAPVPPGPFAGVIVTSANAVPALLGAGRTVAGLSVSAVGTRAAERLRAAGWDVALVAPDAACLARQVLARQVRAATAPGRLLHAAGRDRTGEPALTLEQAGFTVVVWEVYRAVAAARLEVEAVAALSSGALDGVVHYSGRSAAIARSLAVEAGLAGPFARLTHFCLSDEVARALDGTGAPVRVAAAPDEASLLALVR